TADVDDGPAMLFQRGKGPLSQQERRLDVERKLVVKKLGRKALQRRAAGVGGAVDQKIDAAKTLESRVDHPVARGRIRKVGRHKQSAGAQGFQLLLKCPPFLLGAAAQGYRRPPFSQAARDARAQALCAPGDDGVFSSKTLGRSCHVKNPFLRPPLLPSTHFVIQRVGTWSCRATCLGRG